MRNIFTTFVILCLSCILQDAIAARIVDAKKRASETVARRTLFNYRRGVQERNHLSVRELLDLSEGQSMSLKSEVQTAQGLTVQKLRETYRDVPVYNAIVAVERDENGDLTGDASGNLVDNIADDLPDPTPRFSKNEALVIALADGEDEKDRKHVTSYTADNYIYVENEKPARSVYLVSYFISNARSPNRSSVLIDARSGDVVRKWQNFQTFDCGERTYKAYGGNVKMGKLKYGDAPYCLEPTIEGDMCILENKYVRVIDMQSTTDDSRNTTARFECKDGYDDEINGAYSPAIDAFFYGTMVGKMFEEWFHSTPLREKTILRVHYGNNMENAFWDGQYCSFGDGQTTFYPFTSVDVVGHEIGHGVTEQASGLEYRDQSGGLNEAFSDILGEATELFVRRSSDMIVGLDITKNEIMRDFRDPKIDGSSVGHVSEFTSSMDPHYSSGVYRRVFYVLIRQKGGEIRPIVHSFLHANRMYWYEEIGFQEAGCGLLKAAYDLGQNPTAYKRALNDVGVQACDLTEHIRRLIDGNPVGNINISPDIRPLFGFEAPMDSDSVLVEVLNNQNDVRITVRIGTWENDEEARQDLEIFIDGFNSLTIEAVAGRVLFIELSVIGDDVLNGITVTATSSQSTSFTNNFYSWF